MNIETKPPATLLSWLGCVDKIDYEAHPIVGRAIGWFVSLVLLYLFALAMMALAGLGVSLYYGIFPPAGTDATAGLRSVAFALGAIIGLPFLMWRSMVAQQVADTSAQGQITDRLNKAVEGLGATRSVKVGGKDETEPNIEVRIGAIYALERISQDSLRDHVQIMEILTAYVRENSRAEAAQDHTFGEWEPLKLGATEAEKTAHWIKRDERFGGLDGSQVRVWAQPLSAKTDIQAAVSVIGRRWPAQRAAEIADTRHHKTGYRLDLRRATLQGVALRGLHFDRALFQETRLEGADLRKAWLEEADLTGASLEGADLREARLEGTDLRKARLEGADLTGASLEGADLREARLEGTELIEARLERADLWRARLEAADLRQAKLEGANLFHARLEGAHLYDARLEGADLRKARLEGTDLRKARLEGADLRQAGLEGAFLLHANLEGADFSLARLDASTYLAASSCQHLAAKAVDFSKSTDLTQDQLEQMFGDGSTKIPDGLARPAHWPTEHLGWGDFCDQWFAFKSKSD